MLIAGHYEKGEAIGKGGMGIVYRGVDVRDQTPVAIKWLKEEAIASDPIQVERFIREGKLLRKMNHPNIVKMLAADETDGCYYLVMEYVAGGSLLDVMRETRQMSLQRVLYIALDLADALTRAHRLDVLHRDIKPANVLVAADGTPRLTDFGMARAKQSGNTQEGTIVGTLAYLAPEAFHGEEADERTDIWAFGIMLYEMLSGRRPHDDNSPGQLINSIMTQPIRPLDEIRPDLPTALVDLVGRMLQRDRHSRIPSVRLIGAELESIIRGATTSMQYVPAAESTGRFDTQAFTPKPASMTAALRPPSNLPAQPTQFVGRNEELNTIFDYLANTNNRLVTLLGPGGIGKTRLSLAAADQQLTAFRDGVFFVPLAPVDDPEMVTQTIGDVIGYAFNGVDDPRDELVDYLREKQLLLVLDNFEHVVDAAGVLSAILRDAPNVKLIVTSRERLRLRGEQILEVDGMILPEVTDSVETLTQYASVQLFVQSAHRVTPDFEVDQDNVADVAHIIRLVGGLPLGIELAAAWLEGLTIDDIASEIEQSLDFLETDLRDVPERHRSMRAVFDYSWRLLDDKEKTVFIKLSVFRGGFEREAAQKIAGASLRTLTTLVNKSLLRRDPKGRYLMHTLLRQFAEEQFEADADCEEVRMQHAIYYGALIERLGPVFNTRKEADAVDQLAEEKENLRAALYYAIRNRLWDEVDKAHHTILLFYIARSLLREGVELFQWIAEELRADGQQDTDLYWSTLVHEAWLGGRTGSYDRVIELAQPAYDGLLASGNKIGQVRALNMMSYAQMFRGNYAHSVELAQQASDLANEIGANAEWFQAMGNLGYAEFLRRNLQEAKRIYELLAEVLARKPYSPTGIAYNYNNLGEIVRELGDLDRAQDLFEQAYEIFAGYKMKRGMAFTINNIGGIAQTRGDFEEARRCYDEAYRLNREVGDQRGTGHSLSALGNLARYSGDHKAAQRYFLQSMDVRKHIGEQRGVAESLSDLAQNAIAMEDMQAAEGYINQAAEIYQSIGDRQGMGYVAAARGMSALMNQDYDKAHDLLQDAHRVGKEIGSAMLISMSEGGLAMIALAQHNYQDALRYGVPVLQRAVNGRITLMVLTSLGALALVKAGEGKPEIALELLVVVRNRTSLFMQLMARELEDLYQELVTELPDAAVDEITARAQAHDLYTFAQSFLEQNAAAAPG